jgi:hypothetical protein
VCIKSRKQRKAGLATPAIVTLFIVLIIIAILAFNIAMHTIESIRIQSLGIYSLENINRAILYCLANPQSSSEVIVSLSKDEYLEFDKGKVTYISKNKVDEFLIKRLSSQSNLYNGIKINIGLSSSSNGISISYSRELPISEDYYTQDVHFTQVKLTYGSYKLIFFSTSFKDIEVIVIPI